MGNDAAKGGGGAVGFGVLFTLLNAAALLGWTAVLGSLVLQSTGSSFPGVAFSPPADDSEGAPPMLRALLFLEAIMPRGGWGGSPWDG